MTKSWLWFNIVKPPLLHLQVMSGTSEYEMLMRSGTPSFICLPFGLWIHFAISFLPILAFQPYWLGVKVLCQSAWCHTCIFVGDIFYIYLIIFQCGVFQCLSLSLHRMVLHFAQKLLASSWCCTSFCLAFLVHMLCGSCTVGMCHFSCMYIRSNNFRVNVQFFF